MNEFMAAGGEGLNLPEGSRSTPLDITDLDALIAYLQRLRTVPSASENRIFISQ